MISIQATFAAFTLCDHFTAHFLASTAKACATEVGKLVIKRVVKHSSENTDVLVLSPSFASESSVRDLFTPEDGVAGTLTGILSPMDLG